MVLRSLVNAIRLSGEAAVLMHCDDDDDDYSYVLDLTGPELLLVSFALAAVKMRKLTSPLFLLTWAFQVRCDSGSKGCTKNIAVIVEVVVWLLCPASYLPVVISQAI